MEHKSRPWAGTLWLTLVLCGLTWLAPGLAPAGAAERRPLLLAGKKTLFQRVITHPGARLHQAPGAQPGTGSSVIKPFTVYYVYDRRRVEGQEWVEVGPATNAAAGWVADQLTTPWKQALTLLFSERTGRQPVLFFQSRQALDQVARDADPRAASSRLAFEFAARAGKPAPAGFPVLAMEPSAKAVSAKRFYLMPILASEEPYEGVKFLEVACLDPGNPGRPATPAAAAPAASGPAADKAPAGPAGGPPANLHNQRTGIVFVIDTTISMGPYLERVHQVVRRVFDDVAKAGLADKVAFGMVAFRSNLQATPGLEYVTRVISDLKDGAQRALLERDLAQVGEAKVSSHSFNEDAFAGLKTALQDLSWQPYASRLVLLISDAGALRNDDPLSGTGLNENEVADLARSQGIKILALHLKTPAGLAHDRNNHAYAEEQYRALTKQDDQTLGQLYFPIQAGGADRGVASFGQVVETASAGMVRMVAATAKGETLPPPPPPAAAPASPAKAPAATPAPPDPVQEMQRKIAALGYAMQLEFLGQRDQVRAPEVRQAYVADMDLAAPTQKPNFVIAVLLTKNQLSDLQQRLKIILDNAIHTHQTGSKDFFQGILSAATQMTRDPAAFSRAPGANLRQLGVLGEFLEDLPYKSSVQRMTEEHWYSMSVGEQAAFIAELRSKIQRYAEYHDDRDNWEDFGGGNPGDAVYRVPLAMLP
ncbi:MAG: VWA domain-containing protein [Deltaproteobacteria bacterium]|nr:VWA domain-containing protein [Deltaproteobacteria bacterium]